MLNCLQGTFNISDLRVLERKQDPKQTPVGTH